MGRKDTEVGRGLFRRTALASAGGSKKNQEIILNHGTK
jgi:hypothetical protein